MHLCCIIRSSEIHRLQGAAACDEAHRYELSFFFFSHTSTFQILDKPWSQVSSLLPPFLPSNFIAHRVQQSHCSSIFHRALLSHALALSASKSICAQENSQRIYTGMHSGEFELTKLTYTRLEDNLIRHRGDRSTLTSPQQLRL